MYLWWRLISWLLNQIKNRNLFCRIHVIEAMCFPIKKASFQLKWDNLTGLPAGRTTWRLRTWLPNPGDPGHAGVEILVESRVGLALLELGLLTDGRAEPVLGGVQTMALGDALLRLVETSRLGGIVALRQDAGRKQEQHEAAGEWPEQS